MSSYDRERTLFLTPRYPVTETSTAQHITLTMERTFSRSGFVQPLMICPSGATSAFCVQGICSMKQKRVFGSECAPVHSKKARSTYTISASFLNQSLKERKAGWESMQLDFISLTIYKENRNSFQLVDYIEEKLQEHGDPVRWAIIEGNTETGTCRVDAVVSKTETRL